MKPRADGKVLPFTLAEIFTLLFFALLLVLVSETHRREESEAEAEELKVMAAELQALGPAGTEALVQMVREAQDSFPDDFQELVRKMGEKSDQRRAVEEMLQEAGADSAWIDGATEKELLDSLIAVEEQTAEIAKQLAGQLGLSEGERSLAEQMAAEVSQANRENRDLRGQLEWFLARVGNGLDHPPCWPDENGRPEYAYEVEIHTSSVAVRPIWPAHRSEDARSIPGMMELPGDSLSYSEFTRRAIPVLNWSNRQDPVCRHFVVIRDRVDGGKEAFKDALLTVERFFYKLLAN